MSRYLRAYPGLFAGLFWLTLASVLLLAAWPHSLIDANDKLQHVAAFVVLTILASLAYARLGAWRLGLLLSMFGGFIELVQMLPALRRQSDVMDWLADTAAIVVTLVLMGILHRGTGAAAPTAGRAADKR